MVCVGGFLAVLAGCGDDGAAATGTTDMATATASPSTTDTATAATEAETEGMSTQTGSSATDATAGTTGISSTSESSTSESTETSSESDTDPGTDTDVPPPADGAGVFIRVADLERAQERAVGGTPLFESQASLVASRAESALGLVADPFHMDDVTQIRFGWCESPDDVDDTLREATSKFTDESASIRALALRYAMDGDPAYADKATALMLTWAAEQTVINLHDLGVDFENATLDDQTDGYCSDRPWNFALDAMWQTYGLINVSDAYLLLTRNGYGLSPEDDATLRAWILRVTEAVNASHLSWTKWADAHPNSGSYERYRSDNHLSWCLAGLIAAAAALEDDALASYVLDGGSWTDSRSGAYANPSSIRAVIDWAIEPDGRVYEEKILRDPPIGYSLFHLWAMMLVARTAEVHFDDSALWDYPGDDGGGLEAVHDRYAGFILGTKTSPEPEQEGDLLGERWIYEAAVSVWDKPEHREVIDAGDRNTWIIQSIGAVPLLIGAD